VGELGNVELRDVESHVESHVVKRVIKHVEDVENAKMVVADRHRSRYIYKTVKLHIIKQYDVYLLNIYIRNTEFNLCVKLNLFKC
jgi:hypothetical protein